MPTLALETYKNYYNANWISLTSFIALVLSVLMIILPIFMAYYTKGFWQKYSFYYEQPRVEYNDQLWIYVLNVTESTDPNPIPIPITNQTFFSTMLKLNQPTESLLSIPLIKYQIEDNNFDGLNDQFNFQITFRSRSSDIKNIKLWLFFDYYLSVNIVGKMQTLCKIDIDTPHGAGYVHISGDLNLRQRAPWTSATFTSEDLASDFFGNQDQLPSYDTITSTFYNRNISTQFEYDKFVSPLRNSNYTRIDWRINVPSFQRIMWETPSFTSLKIAWLQILAFFIPMYIIIRLIMAYLFKNNVFECTTVSGLPKIKKRIKR